MSVSALTGHTSLMEGFSDFPGFREMPIFDHFPPGFGFWEGLQSIGNGWGLQMDGFSAHFDPSGSIFTDLHDFDHFGVDSSGLMLFPEGPRTLRECSRRVKSLVVGCKAQ